MNLLLKSKRFLSRIFDTHKLEAALRKGSASVSLRPSLLLPRSSGKSRQATQTPHPSRSRCAARLDKRRRQRGPSRRGAHPSQREEGRRIFRLPIAEFKPPRRRRRIIGRRQRPPAAGRRPQGGRPEAAHASPAHGTAAPGPSVRAIAQRVLGGSPARAARGEEAHWGVIFQLHRPPVRTRCRLADAKLACDFSMRGQAVQPPSGVPPLAALAVCAVRPGGRSAAGGAGLRRPQALRRSRRVVATRRTSRTLTERRGSGSTALGRGAGS